MYYAFAGALHIALSAKAAGLTEQHLRKRGFWVQSQIYLYNVHNFYRLVVILTIWISNPSTQNSELITQVLKRVVVSLTPSITITAMMPQSKTSASFGTYCCLVQSCLYCTILISYVMYPKNTTLSLFGFLTPIFSYGMIVSFCKSSSKIKYIYFTCTFEAEK